VLNPNEVLNRRCDAISLAFNYQASDLDFVGMSARIARVDDFRKDFKKNVLSVYFAAV
jgi:hypothetical protein